MTNNFTPTGAMRRRTMRIIPAALVAVAFSMPIAATAEAAASILGSWQGRGSVRVKESGQVEPVSCSVRYEEGSGRTFVLNATCATTAGTFQQSGRIVKLGSNSYSGSLYSDQYAVSGKVSISVSGKSQTIRVNSSKGSGSLKLRKR